MRSPWKKLDYAVIIGLLIVIVLVDWLI